MGPDSAFRPARSSFLRFCGLSFRRGRNNLLPVSSAKARTCRQRQYRDIKRTVLKEPEYAEKPKYCLIVLGTNAAAQAWLVEEGNRLYVDRNANGDLTDDGPPLLPSDFQKLGQINNGPNRWDFSYLLQSITPADGSRHTGINLRHWNYGAKDDSYGLSLWVDGTLPMYAGWFGTLWSDNWRRRHAAYTSAVLFRLIFSGASICHRERRRAIEPRFHESGARRWRNVAAQY